MQHTKETLTALTGTELINIVLEQQEVLKQQAQANFNKPTSKKPALDPDTLFAWLWERRKGSFVRATKLEIMEHFNCTSNSYSTAMKTLYNRGSLSKHNYQGKRITSSHIIHDA